MKQTHFLTLILSCLLIAGILRFVALENRPPHHDEGINGWFVERILKNPKDYQYSPEHYHGPTFFYLATFSSKIFGLKLFSIRLVTALFGFLLCLTPLLLKRELGKMGVVVAMFLLAAGPAFVFYSRYAIHEILLAAFFSLFSIGIYRYFFHAEKWFFYLAAVMLGFSCATKETIVIYTAGVVFGLFFALFFQEKKAESLQQWLRRRVFQKSFLTDMVYFHLVFAVGLLLFFKRNEIVDFFQSYYFYFKLGTKNTGHEKPWPYFFAYFPKYEWFLLIGGLVGLVFAAIQRTRFSLFCVGWALVVFFAHAMIPYKTPWIIVNLMLPLVFLTAEVTNTLYLRAKKSWDKSLFWIVTLSLGGLTLHQSYQLSFKQFYEPQNRYAYVQTVESARSLANQIKGILALNPEEQVDFLSDTEWPYPFLLAGHPKVYFWRRVVDPIDAKIVVARDSQYAEVLPKLKKQYSEKRYNVRPGLDMVLFVAEGELKMPSVP